MIIPSNNNNLVFDNLLLRNLTLEDCTFNYVNWLNDEDVNKYLETRFIIQDIEKIKNFVQTINDSSDSCLFGIFVSDVHIGNIKIGPIHPIYKYADISYFIGDKLYWGKGYAAIAIKLIIDFGFSILCLNRIQAGVHASNSSSVKVLEKCGLKKEVVLRQKIFYNSGDSKIWDDHLYYGILSSEYTNSKL